VGAVLLLQAEFFNDILADKFVSSMILILSPYSTSFDRSSNSHRIGYGGGIRPEKDSQADDTGE
jgi:hypothetical protein